MRRIERVRTATVQRTIEHCVEIPGKHSGHTRVDPGAKIIQKRVSGRVTVGAIETTDTEGLAAKQQLTLQETTISIAPRIDQGEHRVEQNDTTTRVTRSRGHRRIEPGRGKPGPTLRDRGVVRLLEPHNIDRARERPQPLKEAKPFGLVPEAIAIKGEHGHSHDKNLEELKHYKAILFKHYT